MKNSDKSSPLCDLVVAVRKIIRLHKNGSIYGDAKMEKAFEQMRRANSRFKKDKNRRAAKARENMRDLMDRASAAGLVPSGNHPCPDCDAPLRAREMNEGGGVECSKECGYWECY